MGDFTAPPADPALLAAANRALVADLEAMRRERDAWRTVVLRIVRALASHGAEDDAVDRMRLSDADDLVGHIEDLRESAETADAVAQERDEALAQRDRLVTASGYLREIVGALAEDADDWAYACFHKGESLPVIDRLSVHLAPFERHDDHVASAVRDAALRACAEYDAALAPGKEVPRG